MELEEHRHRHLFLTGDKQVGKSTILRKLLDGRTAVYGGFFTIRVLTPDGGEIHMLRAGSGEKCQTENLLFIKRDGISFIRPEQFDRIGCAILAERMKCDILVMDELGTAEQEAFAFQKAVLDCLEESIPVYGVLQKGDSRFLKKIRNHPNIQLVTVTKENRDELPDELRKQGW